MSMSRVIIFAMAQVCDPIVQSSTGGHIEHLQGTDSTLYAARGPGGFEVLDLTDPRSPRSVARVRTSVHAYRLGIAAGRLLVASQTGEIECFDITDPQNPLRGGSLTLPLGAISSVVSHQQYFYLGAGEIGVIDATDAAQPEFLGVVPGATLSAGLDVQGALLASAERQDGAKLYDLSNPALPVLLSQTATFCTNIIIVNSTVYASYNIYLRAIDISDPSSPVLAWEDIDGSSNQTSVGQLLRVEGALCWRSPNGLRCYDLTEPLAPSVLGTKLDWPNSPASVSLDTYLATAPSDELAIYEPRAITMQDWVRRGSESWGSRCWAFGDRAIYGDGDMRIVRLPSFDLLHEWAEAPAHLAWTDGEYFLSLNDGLQIHDIREGTVPTLLSLTDVGATGGGFTATEDHRAYLSGDGVLRTLDWTDPTAPQILAEVPIPWDLRALTAQSTLLCGVTPTGDVVLLDMSDPGNPLPRSSVGGPGRTTTPVELHGSLLFVQNEGIRIFDIQDPDNPVPLARIPGLGATGGLYSVMQVRHDRLYLAGEDGYTVWDIADPTTPIETARGGPLSNFRSLAVTDYDSMVAVASPGTSSSVDLYEVSEPDLATPARLAHMADPCAVNDAVFYGSRAILAGDRALMVADISDPTQPEFLAHLARDSSDSIAMHEDYLFRTQNTSLRITKGLDPLTIRTVALLEDLPIRPESRPWIHHRDGILYIASGLGLIIVDVADPADPTILSQTPGPFRGAVIDGNTIYAALGSGCAAFDISDPSAPTQLSYIELPRSVYRADYDNGLLFVVGEWGRIHTVDFTNPSSPVIIGYAIFPVGHIYRILLDGNTAYCTTQSEFLVFDVSDPTTPALDSASEYLAYEVRPFRFNDQFYVGAGDSPSFIAIDPGCPPCHADFNNDGATDTRDFIDFLSAWADQRDNDCSQDSCSADINTDGTVDTRDFIEFLTLWAAGC